MQFTNSSQQSLSPGHIRSIKNPLRLTEKKISSSQRRRARRQQQQEQIKAPGDHGNVLTSSTSTPTLPVITEPDLVKDLAQICYNYYTYASPWYFPPKAIRDEHEREELRGRLLLACASGPVSALDNISDKLELLSPGEDKPWLQYTIEECNAFALSMRESTIVGPPLVCALVNRRPDVLNWLLAQGLWDSDAPFTRKNKLSDCETIVMDMLEMAFEAGDWECAQVLVAAGACVNLDFATRMSAQIPHCLLVDLILQQDTTFKHLHANYWRLPTTLFSLVRAYLGHPLLTLVQAPGLNPLRLEYADPASYPSLCDLRQNPTHLFTHHKCDRSPSGVSCSTISPFLLCPVLPSDRHKLDIDPNSEEAMELHQLQVREARKLLRESGYEQKQNLTGMLACALGIFWLDSHDTDIRQKNQPAKALHPLSKLAVVMHGPCCWYDAVRHFGLRAENNRWSDDEMTSWNMNLRVYKWSKSVYMLLGPINHIHSFQRARELVLSLSPLRWKGKKRTPGGKKYWTSSSPSSSEYSLSSPSFWFPSSSASTSPPIECFESFVIEEGSGGRWDPYTDDEWNGIMMCGGGYDDLFDDSDSEDENDLGVELYPPSRRWLEKI